jgi:hypothetical protein
LVVGDDPLTLGLARLAGAPHRTLSRWLQDATLPEGRRLVFWDRLRAALLDRDLAAWEVSLAELDRRVGELESALARGRIDEILIDPCAGTVYRISRGTLRRFWRRGWLTEALSRQAGAHGPG